MAYHHFCPFSWDPQPIPPRFLYLLKSIIINTLFPPNTCLSIVITQQNPQLVTTNLASVYLLFGTQAAQQDLGIQCPCEHCCQVMSLKVFQHQEWRLTSILLNQLHFPFSSANDSKSTPLPLYFQEPAWPSASSIHSTIPLFVPTLTEHPLCARRHAKDRDRTESHSAYIPVKQSGVGR